MNAYVLVCLHACVRYIVVSRGVVPHVVAVHARTHVMYVCMYVTYVCMRWGSACIYIYIYIYTCMTMCNACSACLHACVRACTCACLSVCLCA